MTWWAPQQGSQLFAVACLADEILFGGTRDGGETPAGRCLMFWVQWSVAPCSVKSNVIAPHVGTGADACSTSSPTMFPSFQAIDEMGMAVNGTYAIDHNGTVRFKIKYEDGEAEIVSAKMTLEKDDLVFNLRDNCGVEKYRRTKP